MIILILQKDCNVDVKYWISGLDQDNQTRLLYLLMFFSRFEQQTKC
jgi:hypothetical protein